MSSDETYLEAFIESLSTVPHEVRRNLDLIKDLDSSLGCVLSSCADILRRQWYRLTDVIVQQQ